MTKQGEHASYSIKSGTAHGLADTAAFVALLERLPAHLPREVKDLFGARGELFVSRAPGRLDLMGGIADYSGSLVLQLTLERRPPNCARPPTFITSDCVNERRTRRRAMNVPARSDLDPSPGKY